MNMLETSFKVRLKQILHNRGINIFILQHKANNCKSSLTFIKADHPCPLLGGKYLNK